MARRRKKTVQPGRHRAPKKPGPGSKARREQAEAKREHAEARQEMEQRLPVEERANNGNGLRFPVVGMGASAGGLEAFEQFFQNMSPQSGMSFVLVTHLDPRHVSMMTELVGKHTSMPVTQAEDGQRVEPNHVYAIPPNATLTIEKGRLKVGPLEGAFRRMPIDRFFTSLGQDQGENAVCIVLSGSGTDGTIGLKSIKEHGGLTIAQAPESARYDSMPRSAIPTGLVDFVLPVEEMPAKLAEYAKALEGILERRDGGGLDEEVRAQLPKITAAVRRKTGHDFSEYRQKTIIRRVQRRMQVLYLESAAKYVERLRLDPHEAEALFKELLIGVTHFFRDPEAFESLTAHALRPVLEKKESDEELRLWVPACATGEEAYTLAILVKELMTHLDASPQVRIFAGDIDEDGLVEARAGRYPEGIAEHVSPERLERYFLKQGATYQVAKEIREMCIFSAHNVIRHPPFSRIDMVSCRNFMIYLETDLQSRLLSLFHYSLRPGGYLFLGPSESLGAANALFRPIDKKHRIFQRSDVMTPPGAAFPLTEAAKHAKPPSDRAPAQITPAPEPVLHRSLERQLLEQFAPSGAVINENSDVVFISGRTGKFLEPVAGAPNSNIVNMARRGLRLELRAAIHKALKTRSEVIHRGVTVENNGGTTSIDLVVRPLAESGPRSGLYAVLFQEPAAAPLGRKAAPRTRHGKPQALVDDDRILRQLESELQATKDRLQSTVEELETSNKELKSSNEELLSMNEELQSANEEMQTSKEELQSLNEELETVNAELSKKADELDRAYSDLQNLFESTQIATILVDKHLRIKRFTPAATEVFRLIDADVGRPIVDISPRFAAAELLTDIKDVMRTLATRERTVDIAEGRATYTMRIIPYRTVANVIDGVVMTFMDVTMMRHAERSGGLLSAIVESSDDAILSKTVEGIVTSWNQGAEHLLGYTASEMLGRSIMQVVPATLREEERTLLERIRRGERLQHFETARLRKDGRKVDVSLSVSPIRDSTGKVMGVSTIARDITARKRAEAELTAHRERLEVLVRERTAELEQSQDALRTSERLAALGTLSAGLGHDMSNLLMPVRARLEALEGASTPAQRAEDLEAIRQAIDQLQHLSTGLRMLAVDPKSGTGGSVEVEPWWANVLPVFRNVLPMGVQLSSHFERNLPRIGLAPHQLTQAVFNLVQNAADAMRERASGTVTVEVSRDAGMVKVVVSDDGPGMTEETRRRCLEPFFTTKTRGVSTGLGLVLVQGIIKQAGGSIELDSTVGKGTKVSLWLPPASEVAKGSPRGPAVVELRDERVQGYVMMLLTGLGYDPRADGEAAEASLWVGDSDRMESARVFVSGGESRRAVLLGSLPEGAAHPRIVAVGDSLQSLRRALEAISVEGRGSEAVDGGGSAENPVRG